ncbi:hypothetical protein QQF64_018074 [Cirrhinus molitorella]|uniref:UPAR/Ly6 domain-containing protein n=1 Tax=Cirrhinus molitorella TaxID=172907 RepID=A0ABR3LMT2_9TELE
MDLQVSVFLLFILFTAGYTLSCYDCPSVPGVSCTLTSQCSAGITNCLSTTVTVNGTTMKVQSCAQSACLTGSMNFGIGKSSSLCCSTDLCNSQGAPDSSGTPNGKSCYYCDGQSCSNTVSCLGSEDRCFIATVTGFQTQVLKGCISKSYCDATALVPSIGSASCCEGNLCNGAQSVTQTSTQSGAQNNTAENVNLSFLLLCCSLLSFILLH